VCVVCAHRCHSGHFLIPLGYDITSCECFTIKGHTCNSSMALKKPNHVRLCNDFLIPEVPMVMINSSVSTRTVDGIITYVSNDFEINTLISKEPICEIFPHFSDSVSECPSL
jgi:hypothetical protein